MLSIRYSIVLREISDLILYIALRLAKPGRTLAHRRKSITVVLECVPSIFGRERLQALCYGDCYYAGKES